MLCPRFEPRPMQRQLLSSAAIKCLLAYSCLSLSPSSAFFWPSCFRVCLQAEREGKIHMGCPKRVWEARVGEWVKIAWRLLKEVPYLSSPKRQNIMGNVTCENGRGRLLHTEGAEAAETSFSFAFHPEFPLGARRRLRAKRMTGYQRDLADAVFYIGCVSSPPQGHATICLKSGGRHRIPAAVVTLLSGRSGRRRTERSRGRGRRQ